MFAPQIATVNSLCHLVFTFTIYYVLHNKEVWFQFCKLFSSSHGLHHRQLYGNATLRPSAVCHWASHTTILVLLKCTLAIDLVKQWTKKLHENLVFWDGLDQSFCKKQLTTVYLNTFFLQYSLEGRNFELRSGCFTGHLIPGSSQRLEDGGTQPPHLNTNVVYVNFFKSEFYCLRMWDTDQMQ